MKLRSIKEVETGLNVEFINTDSGRHISLEQAISQIEKGNPNYEGYHVVNMKNGTKYIRSNADKSRLNNIENKR